MSYKVYITTSGLMDMLVGLLLGTHVVVGQRLPLRLN
jgi:hypothetical protein